MNRLLAIEKQLVGARLDQFQSWKSQSTVDKDQMMKVFYGPNHQWRTKVLNLVKENPDKFKHYHLLESSRDQMRKSSAELIFFNREKTGLGYQYLLKNPNALSLATCGHTVYDQAFGIKNGVHLYLYTKTLLNLGTEKHQHLVEAAANYRDIGCFGLTQLLHGSNVRGIMTEAHYDHERKQFVLNTPSKEAMKFWIGAAANVANMAVIWAQLYIKEKCYGVHAYVVPIRDRKTHKLLPGVLIGDCGPKAGCNEIDNGFMLFDNFRIPKENQLDRVSGVDQSGNFRSLADNQDKRFGMQFAALSNGRFLIAMTAGTNALNALTIAIRYVCIRRQFTSKPGQKQNLLMEYPLTKRRMMPLLAQCFVYQMANLDMIYQWDLNAKNILDPKNKVVQDLHVISSVIKPKSGWFATDTIKHCRQMLGGHGFSSFSKLGPLYSDNDINNTWEGDNNVLLQQATKFLVESALKVKKGLQLSSPLVSFLKNPPKQNEITITKQSITCPQFTQKFLQFKIKIKLDAMLKKMSQLQKQNLSSFDIWNSSQVFLGKTLALTLGDLFYLQSTRNSLKKFTNQNNKRVVKDLLTLWMLKVYRQDQLIDQTSHAMIEDTMAEYCEKVSLESLGILQSISADDAVIGSPFADPNGQGFQKYMKLIMTAKGVFQKPQWWQIIANRGQ